MHRTSRLRALLGKELLEHWLAALLLLLTLGGALGLMIAARLLAQRSMTMIEAAGSFALVFLPLAALALGNRLVVAEYHGGTQRFVEALPMRRGEMVLVKFLLGLIPLEFAALGAVAVTALIASGSEPVGARFLAIVAVRAATWVFCLWSFFFAMGFLGRFRIPVYLAILILVNALSPITEFEPWEFGPLALIHPQTFPFERYEWPLRALGEALAVGLGCAGLAFGLGSLSEGSAVEALARPMTQKEKVVVCLLFVVGGIAIGAAERVRRKEPFSFTGEAVLRNADANIEVSYGREDLRADAQAVLERLERDLGGLRPALCWETLPPVRVAFRESLDGSTVERPHLARNDGVLLRANFRRRPEWDAERLFALAVHEAAGHVTRGRATFDPRHWFLDGFSRWWAEESSPADPGASPAAPLPLLRALWATRKEGVREEDVVSWERTFERLGDPISESFAWSGVDVLARSRGRESVLALAREWLGNPGHDDWRDTWREWRHPPRAVFERVAGIAWPDFLREWNARLAEARRRPEVAAALAGVPDARAEIAMEPGQGQVRTVACRIVLDRPAAAGATCALAHCPIEPFDAPFAEWQLRHEERLCAGDAGETVLRFPGLYSPGARAFLAVEFDDPTLRCRLRLVATRREVR